MIIGWSPGPSNAPRRRWRGEPAPSGRGWRCRPRSPFSKEANNMINSEAIRSVVKVSGGRGFIIENGHERLVVTAAHCLPHFPPPLAITTTEERTYRNLLGPLDASEPAVWAELLFADPVGDIAVLGSPDNQELW